MRVSRCPVCKSSSHKVIFYLLPMNMCVNEECNTVFGFWTRIFHFIKKDKTQPFGFYIHQGPYLIGLISLLFLEQGDEQDRTGIPDTLFSMVFAAFVFLCVLWLFSKL